VEAKKVSRLWIDSEIRARFSWRTVVNRAPDDSREALIVARLYTALLSLRDAASGASARRHRTDLPSRG
jgi:hypothetical protein